MLKTEENPFPAAPTSTKVRHRHTIRKVLFGFFVLLLVALVAVRAYLPIYITDYVNKTLDNIPGYSGSISDVDLALYRGAYVIKDLKISKDGKDIPIPFVDIRRIDFSVEWRALFRGEIVGEATLDKPKLNFATGSSGTTSQTGVETDWTVPIKKLMPLDINFVEIRDGTITYQDFAAREKVDLSIYNLNAKATNLRNVEDKNSALPSTVTARGKSVGGGDLALDGRMNILKAVPDMEMKAKLEDVNLPALNDYARSAASIDFTTGNLNIYSDLNVKNGEVTGFVKPLATNISLLDLENDPNPIGVIWESVVSVVLEIFKNQPKDQFATQVELSGSIKSPDTNFWSTLRGIFRNAFIQAYSRNFQPE